jgi:hypothetical protein
MIQNNSIRGSVDCIQATGSSSVTILRNDFLASSSYYGVKNSSSNNIIATANYWNDPTGPTHLSNPAGKGAKVSDGVVFSPFSSTAFGAIPAHQTPLILIPGIMGSPLYNDVNNNGILEDGILTGERRWVSLAVGGVPIMDLELNASGEPANAATHIVVSPIRGDDQTVTIDAELQRIPLQGPFTGLVRNLQQLLGYKLDQSKSAYQNEDLFVFTYDWRKTNAAIASYLANFIDFILDRTGANKVNIIAHSMGGIVTKQYLLDQAAAGSSKIDNLIFVGTPHLGSPNAPYSMITGKFLEWYKDWAFDDNTIRTLEVNFAPCYQLFPFESYYSKVGGGAVLYEQSGSKWVGKNFNGLLNFFNGAPGGITYNTSFLGGISAFQKKVETPAFGSMHVYNIVGTGKKTPGRINRYASGKTVVAATLNGDGTVPVTSAKGVAPSSAVQTRYVSGIQHMDLPSAPQTWSLVDAVLQSSTKKTSMIVEVSEADTTEEASALQLTVVGDAAMDAMDSLGRHCKIAADSVVRMDIPESDAIVTRGLSILLLPRGSGYDVKVDSCKSASLDIVANDIDKGVQNESALFEEVAVDSSGAIRLALRTITPNLQLGIDNNGDGVVDTTVKPTTYIVSSLKESPGAGTLVPSSFALEQNFPNPFNPLTTIRYGIPTCSIVKLSVYNTLGQQVALLQDGEQEAGYHEVKFDGSGLSSGVYFYRLTAGTFVETKKLLLVR